MQHSAVMENIVSNLYAKFNDDQLQNESFSTLKI